MRDFPTLPITLLPRMGQRQPQPENCLPVFYFCCGRANDVIRFADIHHHVTTSSSHKPCYGYANGLAWRRC